MHRIYKSPEGEQKIRERYLAFLRHWPVPCRHIRISTSKGETFVIACGPEDGPALVLLHGGAGNSAMWMGEVTAFASSFQVLCIDLIGEPGLSAPSRPPRSSEAYATWLGEVLDGLGVERACILGVSLGGWLALDFAIRRPARVERIAVLCPGGVGRQKIGIVFLTLILRMFGGWGKRKLLEKILGRAPANPSPPVRAFIEFVALIHRNFRPRMVRLPVFSDDALSKLNVPLLAIVGGKDVLLDSRQTKRRLERHAPNAQVVYLPDAGHLVPPQTQRIVEFMRSSPTPT